MRKEYQEILNHSYSFFTCNVTWGGNNRNFYPSFISLFYWVTIFLKSCIYISYSQHTIPRLPKSIFESQLGILDEFPNLTLHVMTSTFHTTHIRIFFFFLPTWNLSRPFSIGLHTLHESSNILICDLWSYSILRPIAIRNLIHWNILWLNYLLSATFFCKTTSFLWYSNFLICLVTKTSISAFDFKHHFHIS